MIFSMKIYLVYFFAKRVKKIKNKPVINQDYNNNFNQNKKDKKPSKQSKKNKNKKDKEKEKETPIENINSLILFWLYGLLFPYDIRSN